MKFVHMADLHMDKTFDTLNQIEGLPQKRRMEQREALREIIEYIKENNVELLLIAGDLYEQNYIRRSTIDYVNKLFQEIPETKIVITPGNHDPYLKNSFYATYNWAPNVYIFKDKIEKIDIDNIHVYGFGFTDFYMRDSEIENIKIEDKDDINILLTHATLDAATDHYNHRDYNPIKKSQISELGFDYVALGHVHKPSYDDEKDQNICYSGSCLSLGFDEQGQHGIIVGEIEQGQHRIVGEIEQEQHGIAREYEKGKLNIQFKPIDKREFVEIELDISEMNSNEEVVEKIQNLEFKEKNLYKIGLIGKRFFNLDLEQIKKLHGRENVVKIKNYTKIGVDIEQLKNNNDIRGIFIRKMLEKKEKENLSEEFIEKAIEIGLEVL